MSSTARMGRSEDNFRSWLSPSVLWVGDFAQAVRQACAKECAEAWQAPFPALKGLQNGFVSGKTQGCM